MKTPRHVEPHRQALIRTLIAADGPRYKALGNSWAVPCGKWILSRIEACLRRMDGMAD
jgi:hypothetical protein